MEHDRIWYLKKFNLFEFLTPEEMESLNKMVVDSLVKKGNLYIWQAIPMSSSIF